MPNLADLIAERQNKYDVQLIKAKSVDQEEADWIGCKNHIRSLPIDYEKIFRKTLTENPTDVHKHQGRKVVQIRTYMGKYNGFETQLIINEHPEEGVKNAYYAAFNRKTNTAFLRVLYGNL